jgi:gentisate 1,2-dioxygenase
MIVIITRKTYDRVVRLSPPPHKHGNAVLTENFAMVLIPDALGEELARIHKHSEAAIEIVLEGIRE